MKQINFATTNAYKIQFANNILNKLGWSVIPTEVTIIEPQSTSQEIVAEHKVREAYKQTNHPIVTMDSGLFITTLKGFPGTYTSDVFKMLTSKDILKLMEEKDDRSATLQQTVAYFDGNVVKLFTSKAEGVIATKDQAKDGKTYDGLFFETKSKKLKIDMSEDEMGEMWGNAWIQLAEFLQSTS